MITEIEKYIIKSLIISPKNDKEIGYNSALIMLLKGLSTGEHVDMESTFNANNSEPDLVVNEALLLRVKKRVTLRDKISETNSRIGETISTKSLDEVIDLVEAHAKLSAVKKLKEITLFGLKEAKDCVDALDIYR